LPDSWLPDSWLPDSGPPGLAVVGALTDYGWTDRVAALFGEYADAGLCLARVVRVERSLCVAVLPDGTDRPLPAAVLPAVGDWIATDGQAVRAVLPQWSALTRADPSGGGLQVLAANLDVVIVTAPADRLSPARVERELALAWDGGAQPLVAVTKSDLDGGRSADRLRDRLVGADVVEVSAATGVGVEAVATRLRPSRTAVLLGPSGAGKSTLANALAGAGVLATGAVREADHRGRHTTTSRQLIVLPGGGVLIDTPGLRSLGLGRDVELGPAFPDVEEWSARCRFADCQHEVEPGCAVAAAVEAGDLAADRLASFRKLQREVAAEARRTDPLLRKAELSIWKARAKSARQYDKRKPRR
jgi:ribosome biogenesis GTPase / thiamine phosphate phosphatase